MYSTLSGGGKTTGLGFGGGGGWVLVGGGVVPVVGGGCPVVGGGCGVIGVVTYEQTLVD